MTTKLSISKTELESSINWTLTKIVNNIDVLDVQKNILGYISNSVKNFCIDEYRKISVRKKRDLNYKKQTRDSSGIMSHTIEFMLEDLSRNEEEKTILTRIILEKTNLSQISKEMNIPMSKIDSLMTRVKEQLSH